MIAMEQAVLAVDVGSGTQDILLYLPGRNVENCPKLVMPSRTQIVAAKIREVTAKGEDIFLSGSLMGGGACAVAVRRHLEAGLKVYATCDAARTFNDDLAKVEAMGVMLVKDKPDLAREIVMGDLDLTALAQALNAFGLKLPDRFAVALQDHGESLGMSNRQFRFRLWQEFIEGGGELKNLIYHTAPGYLTRMQALQGIVPNSYILDTGAAAVWGMLCDPKVKSMQERGFIALNIGNSHTLAMAVLGRRVLGVFEYHTGQINTEFLATALENFKAGKLQNDEVFAAGGHGSYIHKDYPGGFSFVALTGPRWEMAQGLGAYRVAPFGDMMLTGCFGLLNAGGII